MATYAQPYPNQPYGQRSTYPPIQQPPTWTKPPYAGAPPPIPVGVSVNPQQWQAGSWQMNPAFKHSANPPPQQQHVPWIPSHHWTQSQRQPQHMQQPQQQQAQASASQAAQSSQQASYNPYKRVPKPPSKEYLETALSDNPLGLENMVPVSVEQYYRQGHQTPWIWKPRDLDDDDSNPNGSSAPNQARRHTDGDLNHQVPESFTTKRDLQPTFSSKIVRTPEHYRHDSVTNTPSPKRAASYSSIDSSLSSRMSGLSTNSNNPSPSSSTPLSRQSTMPISSGSSSSTSFSTLWSASPTKHDFSQSSAPMLTDHLSEEPDSMLSPLVLAKTPLLPAPGNLRTVRNHPNPLLATQSLDTIPEAPSYQNRPIHSANNTVRPPEPQQQQQSGGNGGNYYGTMPVQHANSMPNPPTSQYVYPTHPPQMRLPPKNPDQDHDWEREREREREREEREQNRERERGIGTRHTTYVDPHFTQSGTAHNTPSPRSRVPSRPSSRPSSAQPSPTTITPPTYPISPPPHQYAHAQQQQQQQQYVYSHPQTQAHAHPAYPSPSTTITSPASHAVFSPTPSSFSSSTTTSVHPTSSSSTPASSSRSGTTNPTANPLPPPPQLTQRAPVLPSPRTPPAHFQTRTRRGFWNRRGDHLTADGYIVYAPSSLAYPPELASYPEENVGYQDHHKLFAAHVLRPELPQSLPKHGMPPECPYEAFIVYEYT